MDIVKISGISFPTILAITDKEKELGLMYKRKITTSMSFIYNKPEVNKFWMKNTVCSLDIVFCHNQKIVDIQTGTPYSTALIGQDILSDTVIEFAEGTCKENKISVGSKVEMICCNDSLRKIFAHFNKFTL